MLLHPLKEDDFGCFKCHLTAVVFWWEIKFEISQNKASFHPTFHGFSRAKPCWFRLVPKNDFSVRLTFLVMFLDDWGQNLGAIMSSAPFFPTFRNPGKTAFQRASSWPQG